MDHCGNRVAQLIKIKLKLQYGLEKLSNRKGCDLILKKEEIKIDKYYYCNFTGILYKIYYFSQIRKTFILE